MPLTKLIVCLLLTPGASTTIGGNGTCTNGGDCENDTPKQDDISALYQSKNAEVLTTRVPSKDDPNMASMRPRMQKLMEISGTVNDIEALVKAGVTPEVEHIIEDLIRVIKDDLQEKIKSDQTSTQVTVGEHITALTETTQGAVEAKTQGDQSDTSLNQCIMKEKGLVEAFETSKSEEEVLETETPSADYCGHPDFDIAYPDPPQLPNIVTVDFSKGLSSVQEQLDEYLVPLNTWIASMKDRAAIDQGKWDAANERCNAKKKELKDKTTEYGERVEVWRAQHADCIHAMSAQEASLCEFGHDYQSKCAAKAAFDALKTDITGSGTSYSEPDRKQEWRQTTRLTCVLHELKSTTELTTGAVDTCTKSDGDAAEEFENDVGSIDLKQNTYDLLTSPANFSCAEAEIPFGSGVLWTVPKNSAGVAGWLPKSTDYTKAEGYKYAIDADSRNAPFAFCSGH